MNTNDLLKQAGLDLIELLYDGQVCLAAILGDKLPSLYKPDDKTWWEHRVDDHLSPLQKNGITEERINALDLAGLLTVLKGNGRDIFKNKKDLSLLADQMQREIRQDYLAHRTVEEIKEPSAEDIYRHLDTLERFLKVIEGDEHLVQQVRNSKFNMVPLLRDQELPRELLSGDLAQGGSEPGPGETGGRGEFGSAPTDEAGRSDSGAPKTDGSQEIAPPSTVKHDPVIGGYGKAIPPTPDDTKVYFDRGLPKLSGEQYDAALKACNKAVTQEQGVR